MATGRRIGQLHAADDIRPVPHGPPEAGEHRVIGSRLGVVDPIELRMAHIRAPLELGDRHVDCLAGLDLDQLPARR
jgi:hypothetical protein